MDAKKMKEGSKTWWNKIAFEGPLKLYEGESFMDLHGKPFQSMGADL